MKQDVSHNKILVYDLSNFSKAWPILCSNKVSLVLFHIYDIRLLALCAGWYWWRHVGAAVRDDHSLLLPAPKHDGAEWDDQIYE